MNLSQGELQMLDLNLGAVEPILEEKDEALLSIWSTSAGIPVSINRGIAKELLGFP